jgi:predicted nuclease of predicted toxin-antitoxin system
MRFLVDENLPRDVADLLREAGHDVTSVRESLRGARDEEVWNAAAREKRVIITRDLDYPLMKEPRPPGVLLLRVPDTFTRHQMVELMRAFLQTESFKQLHGTVTVLSPGQIRSRPLHA